MKMGTNKLFKHLLALCLTLLILLPTNTYAWTTDDLTSTTWPYLVGWTGGKATDYARTVCGKQLTVRSKPAIIMTIVS